MSHKGLKQALGSEGDSPNAPSPVIPAIHPLVASGDIIFAERSLHHDSETWAVSTNFPTNFPRGCANTAHAITKVEKAAVSLS